MSDDFEMEVVDTEELDPRVSGSASAEQEDAATQRDRSTDRWSVLGTPPDDWQTAQVGEVTRMRNGKATDHLEEGEAEYVVYGSNGPIGSYHESNFDGGLVIGRVGAVGEVEWVPEPSWVSDNAIQLSIRDSVNGLYLYYCLDNYEMEALATTTAQPLLNQSTVARISIPIPPLSEQRKIASVLYTIDRLLKLSSSEELRNLKTGLMQDLLTGEVRTADKDIEVLDEVEAHG